MLYTTEHAQPFNDDLQTLHRFLDLVRTVAVADSPTRLVLDDLSAADEVVTDKVVLKPVYFEAEIGGQAVRRVVDYESTTITFPLRRLGTLAACTDDEYADMYMRSFATGRGNVDYGRASRANRCVVARAILVDLGSRIPLTRAFVGADLGRAMQAIKYSIELLGSWDSTGRAAEDGVGQMRSMLRESATLLRAGNGDATPLSIQEALANIDIALDSIRPDAV